MFDKIPTWVQALVLVTLVVWGASAGCTRKQTEILQDSVPDTMIVSVTPMDVDEQICGEVIHANPNALQEYEKVEVRNEIVVKSNNDLRQRVLNANSRKQALIAVKSEIVKNWPNGYRFKNAHTDRLNDVLADFIVTDILTGIPYEIIATQDLNEGAYKTKIGKEGKNPSNIKFTGEGKYDGQLPGYLLHFDDCKDENGKPIPCKFVKFETYADGLIAHTEVIRKPYYTDVYKQAGSFGYYNPYTGDKILDRMTYAIGIGGFAHGPDSPYSKRKKYTDKLRRVIRETGLDSGEIRERLGLPLRPEYYSLIKTNI